MTAPPQGPTGPEATEAAGPLPLPSRVVPEGRLRERPCAWVLTAGLGRDEYGACTVVADAGLLAALLRVVGANVESTYRAPHSDELLCLRVTVPFADRAEGTALTFRRPEPGEVSGWPDLPAVLAGIREAYLVADAALQVGREEPALDQVRTGLWTAWNLLGTAPQPGPADTTRRIAN